MVGLVSDWFWTGASLSTEKPLGQPNPSGWSGLVGVCAALWSVVKQTVDACPLGCVVKKPLRQPNLSGSALVHLGTLKSFLGQLGLLLLVDPWPSGTWLSGVLVPDLCRGWLRAPC